MGSKHEQIGSKGGNRKKKIFLSNTRLESEKEGYQSGRGSGTICRLQASDLGLIVRGLYDKDSSSELYQGHGLLDISMDGHDEQAAAALDKLQTITGLKLTEANVIVRDDMECCINGFLGHDSIVIVKIVKSKQTLEEMAKLDPTFCLQYTNCGDGRLILSDSHNDYYQVQGSLEICDKQTCYFVVSGPEEFHYQIINRQIHRREVSALGSSKLINF